MQWDILDFLFSTISHCWSVLMMKVTDLVFLPGKTCAISGWRMIFFFLPLYFPCRKTDTYRMYDHMCTNKQCKYLTLCKRCRYLEENLSVFLCDRFMSEYFFSEEVNSKEALTNCEWWNRKWHMPVRPTGGEGGEPVWRCDYDVPVVMLQSC